MRQPSTRRRFLESSAAAMGAAGISMVSARPLIPGPSGKAPMKVAALATTYFYLSHAYHIVGRFLDGFMIHGPEGGLHKPPFEVASLFIEQVDDATDLGRAKARKHGVRLSPTIEDALTLGTDEMAVDAVLLIGEHGNYPLNDRLQKLYPRGRFFSEVLQVVRKTGRPVPVFIDKHLSYDRNEARLMVDRAKELQVPLMAGSSLPVTWRLPELEIPLGREFADVIVASRGAIEIFGFHALETLQCFAERRDRHGKPQGVKAVTFLEGDAVWQAAAKGLWSRELLGHALARSHTLNPGDIEQNTRDYVVPSVRDNTTMFSRPLAFLVEYVDGLKAAALILNGHVDDTTIAVKLADGSVASTLVYLPAPPGARFFDPLVLRIEDFFQGRPPYPVERTLLTGGILDVALQSRVEGGRTIETPELASIDYEPPANSGFIRTPVAGTRPIPE